MTIRISAIGYAPIKSTKFTWVTDSRTAVHITGKGIRYDRQWLIVDEHNMFVAQRRGSLPAPLRSVERLAVAALTPLGLGVEVRSLCQISARLAGDDLVITAPGMSALVVPAGGHAGTEQSVSVWRDGDLAAVDQGKEAAVWFSEFISRERPGWYRLMRMSETCERRTKDRGALIGFHDAFPFMVYSEESLTLLNQKLIEAGAPSVPHDRFRANLLFRGAFAHWEDSFRFIKVGAILFEGMTLCDRCPIIDTDQTTAARGTAVQAMLATYRRGSDLGVKGDKAHKIHFGRNCNHHACGCIHVGDVVEEVRGT